MPSAQRPAANAPIKAFVVLPDPTGVGEMVGVVGRVRVTPGSVVAAVIVWR
jgi:hypothetical protein